MLIAELRKRSIKTDADFFNMLIKKRSMRFDYEGAREIMKALRASGIRPDIVTYGVLAMGCTTQELGEGLLSEMASRRIRLVYN
jgi:pentatricopeptide repeat domain-containing protein 1